MNSHLLHSGLGSIQIPQGKISWGEWVDGPCHHGHHHWGFSKVLPQGLTTAVHMIPTQDALVVLAQLSKHKRKNKKETKNESLGKADGKASKF